MAAAKATRFQPWVFSQTSVRIFVWIAIQAFARMDVSCYCLLQSLRDGLRFLSLFVKGQYGFVKQVDKNALTIDLFG
jgi:hypothetical protein